MDEREMDYEGQGHVYKLPSIDRIKQLRAVLTSVTFQFASQTQQIRYRAIDKIVEQTLFYANRKGGLTEQEVLNLSSCGIAYASPALKAADVHMGIMRLLEGGRIVPIAQESKYNPERFVLTLEASEDQQSTYNEYEARIKRIIRSLFKGQKRGPECYRDPFFDCLCQVFSRLGDANVRLLLGQANPIDSTIADSVKRAISKTLHKYSWLDAERFEAAIYAFLRGVDADYAVLKWHLAQTYFISRALGLDAQSGLLSKELFGNSTLLLDTNVVLAAVEPESKHNASFHTLVKACKSLDIILQVSRISLRELYEVTANYEDQLRKVEGQIPAEMYDSIGGTFFSIYRHEKETHGEVDFDKLFSNLYGAEEILKNDLGIEIVDDKWFTLEQDTPATEQYAKGLIKAYLEKRKRAKRPTAARHDALLIRWVERERERTGTNVRILSVDTSLPTFVPPGQSQPNPPLAISLSALLQWISTMAVSSIDEDDIAFVFSEIVKQDLLPRERLFQLEDFGIFSELGLQCSSLPVDDLENLISELKVSGKDLNPHDPRDLLQLSYIVHKFLSDPTRSYKLELRKLEEQIERLRSDHDREREHDREKHKNELKTRATIVVDEIRSRAVKKLAYLVVSLLLVAVPLIIWYFTSNDGRILFLVPPILFLWGLVCRITMSKDELEAAGFDPDTFVSQLLAHTKGAK